MVGTYNGYCFNTVSPGEGHSVLNPWDVLSVLDKSERGKQVDSEVWAPHWVNSAGSSLLPHLTSQSYLLAGAYGGVVPHAAFETVTAQQVASLPSATVGLKEIDWSVPPVAVNNMVLLQAGYLTISSISKSGVTLAPPNQFVEDAIRGQLAKRLQVRVWAYCVVCRVFVITPLRACAYRLCLFRSIPSVASYASGCLRFLFCSSRTA